MLRLLVLLPVVLAPALSSPQNPRDVVREAGRAVEGDSTAIVGARWKARLARDSSDQLALLGLATLARLTYDSAGAHRAYSRLMYARAPSRITAYATLGWAEYSIFRAPLDTAAARLERAAATARIVADSAAEAEALLYLSSVRVRLGAPIAALEPVERASKIVAQGDVELQAGLHCLRAGVLVILDQPSTVSEARTGIELAGKAHDRRLEAYCWDMLGWYQTVHGQDPQVAFDSAVVIAQKAHDRFGLALALWWRGSVALDSYNLAAAQRDLSAAIVEARASGNNFVEGWTWSRLAMLAAHFSDARASGERFAQAEKLLRQQGDGWGAAFARGQQGITALASGNLDEAEAGIRSDLAWAVSTAQDAEQLFARLGLVQVAMRRADWERAEREIASARTFALAHGLTTWLGVLRYDAGVVALRRHQLAAAEHLLVPLIGDASESELRRYSTRLRLAETYFAAGSPARAERELTLAADELDAMRRSLDDRTLRILTFQVSRLGEDTEHGFATILAGIAAAGRVDAAFILAERRRARELGDALGRTGVLDAASKRRASGTDAPEDLVRLIAAQPTIGKARTGDTGAVAQVETARDASDSVALFEFVAGRGDEPTTLFVLTRARRVAYPLPAVHSLEPDINALGDLLESGADPRQLGRRLGDALLARAIRELPPHIDRLLIVPDGGLYRVPFDALVMPDGRFFVERFTISTTPSAAVAAVLRSRASARTASGRVPRLLSFGDPAFARERQLTTGAAEDTYRDAFAANGGLARLPASADEARLVARYAPHAVVRLREDASESFIKRTVLDSFSVLHFATHALVDEETQSRTALAVAPGQGEDGFLGAEEIAALHLDADLVVLSACRTARGVVIGGEGIQGLAAPLLQAGARSVVASQWRVEDRATQRFMGMFYSRLASGLPLGVALRQAKLASMHEGAAASTWAAFTIVGDPLERIAMRTPPTGVPWVRIALALVLLVGVVAALAVARRAGRSPALDGVR